MFKKISALVLSIMMVMGFNAVSVYASDSPVTLVYSYGAGTYTVSEDGLTADMKRDVCLEASERKIGGKWYWETTIGENLDGSFALDLYDGDEFIMRRGYVNYYRADTYQMVVFNDNNWSHIPVNIKATTGNVIGMAFNGENGILDFYLNGVKFYTFDDLDGYTSFLPAITCLNDPLATFTATVNFGRTTFAYEMPPGYMPYDNGGLISDSSLRILMAVDEQARLSLSNVLGDNSKVNWSSSDVTVASVGLNDGVVSAIAKGETTITAAKPDGTYISTIHVKVVDQFDGAEWRLAYDLNVGETGRLYFTGDDPINWSSMDTTVASVDGNGQVTAVGPGLAIIQAEHNGYSEIIYVRVR